MSASLPSATTVVVVCAHPDDESFGLGAIITAFADQGARVAVVCFTHGEASTLHGVAGELYAIRERELRAASDVLGVSTVHLLTYADGHLDTTPLSTLTNRVVALACAMNASLLVTFDDGGITGHADHQRATDAAKCAATTLGVPLLAWTIPDKVAAALNQEFSTCFCGRSDDEIDLTITVDRTRQHQAIACHRSQCIDNPVLWRRLELLGTTEHLRHLVE